jgi:hypothetical protein
MEGSDDTAHVARLRRMVSVLLAVLVLLYALAVVVKLAREPQLFQLTFRTCYASAQAFSQGLDPYDVPNLQQQDPGVQGAYGYPPITLYFFLPFAALPFQAAYMAFLAIKILCLVGLVWLWHRHFLKRPLDGLFLLICLLGFNFALYWDLASGNVGLIEQLLLWTGLYAYLRGRLKTFAVLVALSASFKLALILFLALLIIRRGRRRHYALFLGIGVYAAMLAFSSVFYSEMTIIFLQNLQRTGLGLYSGGPLRAAPSSGAWRFLNELSATACGRLGTMMAAEPAAAVGYLLLLVLVTLVTWAAVRSYLHVFREDGYLVVIMLFCLAYLLVLPRLVPCSYILALPAAYCIALKIRQVPALLALAGAAAISTSAVHPPGFNLLQKILPPYYPLLLTFVLWAAGVCFCMWGSARPKRGTEDAQLSTG